MIRIGIAFSDDEADSIVLITNRIDRDIVTGRCSAYCLEEDEGTPYEVKWGGSSLSGRAKRLAPGGGSYPVVVEVIDDEARI